MWLLFSSHDATISRRVTNHMAASAPYVMLSTVFWMMMAYVCCPSLFSSPDAYFPLYLQSFVRYWDWWLASKAADTEEQDKIIYKPDLMIR